MNERTMKELEDLQVSLGAKDVNRREQQDGGVHH